MTGKAVLVLKDGHLRVKLHARDLVPDMLHPQHIHGLDGSTNATCMPPSAAGDDGVLTLVDGLPFYGPVLLPLTPFPMADKGTINYHDTFDVDVTWPTGPTRPSSSTAATSKNLAYSSTTATATASRAWPAQPASRR